MSLGKCFRENPDDRNNLIWDSIFLWCVFGLFARPRCLTCFNYRGPPPPASPEASR